MSQPDPFKEELEREEEMMKEKTHHVISHIAIFALSAFAGFYCWWNFGFYFGALIVVAATAIADIVERLCGKESGWFVLPAMAGHIVYWLILAYILRGLWKPFGGLFG